MMMSVAIRVLLHNSRCFSNSPTLPILTLFTKKHEHCSLCDEAKQVLNKYSSKFQYEEQYIDEPGNQEWFDKYKYDIPVIHLNGVYLMKHRVNERLLLKALDEQ